MATSRSGGALTGLVAGAVGGLVSNALAIVTSPLLVVSLVHDIACLPFAQHCDKATWCQSLLRTTGSPLKLAMALAARATAKFVGADSAWSENVGRYSALAGAALSTIAVLCASGFVVGAASVGIWQGASSAHSLLESASAGITTSHVVLHGLADASIAQLGVVGGVGVAGGVITSGQIGGNSASQGNLSHAADVGSTSESDDKTSDKIAEEIIGNLIEAIREIRKNGQEDANLGRVVPGLRKQLGRINTEYGTKLDLWTTIHKGDQDPWQTIKFVDTKPRAVGQESPPLRALHQILGDRYRLKSGNTQSGNLKDKRVPTFSVGSQKNILYPQYQITRFDALRISASDIYSQQQYEKDLKRRWPPPYRLWNGELVEGNNA